MSEHTPQSPEQHEPQAQKSAEHKGAQQHHERELTQHERQHGSQKHVESIASQVEQKAVSKDTIAMGEREQPKQGHPITVNRHMKDMAFTRAIIRARKRLSAPDKLTSKIIHNPAVDAVSEFTAKTVARPSGMLGGAFFAFVGSSIFLWASNRYGYEYNYLVLAAMFVAGLVVGLAIEGIVTIVKKAR